MNLLPEVSLIRLGVYAAIALSLVGVGAGFEHRRMQAKLDTKVAEFNQFKGGVEALGREAAKDAANKDLWNTLNKRKADEDNALARAADLRTIERLRADAAARDTRGGSATQAPAGSRCPPGQTCFDTAQYQRTLGEFDTRTRQLADECTAIATNFDTARAWAIAHP